MKKYRAEIRFLNDNTLGQIDVDASSKQDALILISDEVHPAPVVITSCEEL